MLARARPCNHRPALTVTLHGALELLPHSCLATTASSMSLNRRAAQTRSRYNQQRHGISTGRCATASSRQQSPTGQLAACFTTKARHRNRLGQLSEFEQESNTESQVGECQQDMVTLHPRHSTLRLGHASGGAPCAPPFFQPGPAALPRVRWRARSAAAVSPQGGRAPRTCPAVETPVDTGAAPFSAAAVRERTVRSDVAVVLVEPQIPQNAGAPWFPHSTSAVRALCAATWPSCSWSPRSPKTPVRHCFRGAR